MLVPVRKGHELDEAKLSEYLAQAIPSFKAPLKNLSQFQGGQVRKFCVFFILD